MMPSFDKEDWFVPLTVFPTSGRGKPHEQRQSNVRTTSVGEHVAAVLQEKPVIMTRVRIGLVVLDCGRSIR